MPLAAPATAGATRPGQREHGATILRQGQRRSDSLRAYRPALCLDYWWEVRIPWLDAAIFPLHRRRQPALHIEQHPAAVGMCPHSLEEQIMWNRVEERLYVEVEHPVVSPAALTGRARTTSRESFIAARTATDGIWSARPTRGAS